MTDRILDALIQGYRDIPSDGDTADDHAFFVRSLPVVVKGDLTPLLACAIARLADAHTPDVDYARGAAEALAEVAERIADLDGTEISMRALRQVLEAAAAEIGVDAWQEAEA